MDTLFQSFSGLIEDPHKKTGAGSAARSAAGERDNKGGGRADANGRDATFKQWMLAEAVNVGRAMNGKGPYSAKNATAGNDKGNNSSGADPFFCCE